LPYKIGKVENKVDYGLNYSKYLDEVAWSHGDILRKAEPYELEQIKYNL
jgi:hypothetical protein